jgi:hypothetical protein
MFAQPGVLVDLPILNTLFFKDVNLFLNKFKALILQLFLLGQLIISDTMLEDCVEIVFMLDQELDSVSIAIET